MYDGRRSGIGYRFVLLMAGILVATPMWAGAQAGDKQSRPPKPEPSASSSNRVTECDTLAAHPHDPNRRAPGVFLEGMKVDQAVAACRLALQRSPGDPVLEYQLGRALYLTKQAKYHQDVAHYLQSATHKQYPQAFCLIGSIFVDENDEKAFLWFEQGAKLGASDCQFAMGERYRLGLGSGLREMATKDYTKAKYWYEQAKKNGHPNAQKALAQLAHQPATDAANAMIRAFGGGGRAPAPAAQHPCLENPQASGCQTPSYSSPVPQPEPVPPINSFYGPGPGGSFYGN